jgi:peroxiredoxin
MSVNDAFVMNAWAKNQDLKNVKVIPDGNGEFTDGLGMLVEKNNLGFGLRSWRYAAIIEDCKIIDWFEEPGYCDNFEEDPYGETKPENVLTSLQLSM